MNRIFKRALSLLLCLVLCLTLLPHGQARADESGTYNGMKWKASDGKVTITGHTDDLPAALAIPAEIDGKPVTKIGYEAFRECSGLTSVSIPDSVTEIGDSAFSGCTALTSAVIGSGVSSLGSYVFGGCTGLTEIRVAEGNACYSSDRSGVLFNKDKTVLIRAPGAISGSYVIPESVTSFATGAFSNCSGLTGVTIPENVSTIERDAFSFCRGLTSIVIPDGVTSIGLSAFYGCSGLTSLTIPNSVTCIGFAAFSYCSGLTSLTIPNSVASIESSAFSYCSGLTSVTIPDSVSEIKASVFNGCTGLTSVTIPNSVRSIGKNAFSDCSGLASVTIPNSVTTIGEHAFEGCSSLASVTIPNSVFEINAFTFCGCSSLTSIVIPDSVWNIGNGAFSASGLTSVTIPSSVSRIRERTFANCSSLTSVIISEGVNNIEEAAFRDCSALTSVTIPKSVTSIGHYAFQDCSALTSVTFRGSAPEIYWSAFSGVTATVYYPDDPDLWPEDKKEDYEGQLDWVGVVFELSAPSLDCSSSPVSGKITLYWGEVEDAVKYQVYRSTTQSGGYTKVYTTAKHLSWTDSDVTTGTTYYYKVRAVDADGEKGPFSPVVTAACRPVMPALSASGSTLNWTAVDGAAKYQVYRSASKTGTYTKVYTSVTKLSWTDINTAPGSTYYYKVRAVDENGENGPFSLILPVTISDPAKPTLSVGSSSVSGNSSLSWTAVDGAAKYQVYRSTEKTGTYKKVYTSVSKLSWIDSDVTSGTTYYYKVRAVDGNGGNGPFSSIKSVTCSPAAITISGSVTTSTGKPSLSWTAVDGAAKYQLYRSVSESGSYSKVYTAVTALSWKDSGAASGTTYYYKVCAVDENGGAGPFSAPVALTCKPARVTGVSVTIDGSGKPVISWSAADGAEQYQVYCATNKDGSYSKLATVTGTSYTNSAAEKGVKLYYKVRAVSSNGTAGAFSSVYSGTATE